MVGKSAWQCYMELKRQLTIDDKELKNIKKKMTAKPKKQVDKNGESYKLTKDMRENISDKKYENEIKNYLKQGLSVKEIAMRLKIKVNRLYQYCHYYGIKIRAYQPSNKIRYICEFCKTENLAYKRSGRIPRFCSVKCTQNYNKLNKEPKK